MTPTVSVIIPSYNHENFIEECIESVLRQSFQDFEIIITDDSSTDHTVDVINRFTDPRIKLFVHPENMGACVAANNCIMHSSGKYIAMLSSDDLWYPDKLAIQVKYLEEHPNIAAVFGKVTWIDEHSNVIDKKDFPYQNVFEVENRTRQEWLRHFFKFGNCLCHPSCLIRKTAYDNIGLLNSAFANLPDFDFWIRLCLNYEIYILDQKLVYFRRIHEEINASGDNPANRIRNRFEFKQILNHYLKLKEPDELLMVFPEAIEYGNVSKDLIPYFLGRIAIDKGIDFFVLWGLETIYSTIQDQSVAKELATSCGFTYLDFIKLSGKYDTFGILNFRATSGALSAEKPTDPTIVVGRARLFLSASKRFLKSSLTSTRSLLGALRNYIKDLFVITTGPNHERDKLILPEPTENIQLIVSELEPVSGDPYLYHLSGQAYTEKLEEEPYERFLVLKSKSRIFFYPIKSDKNSDDKTALQVSDKEGFSVVLSRSVLLPDIYSLGILFRYLTNQIVQYAVIDRIVVYTEGQLRLESAQWTHKSQSSKIKSFFAAIKAHLKDLYTS